MKFEVGRDWNADWVNKKLYLDYFIVIEITGGQYETNRDQSIHNT
jgi:hypothetical protein